MPSIMWNTKTVTDVWRRWQEEKFDGIIVFDGNRGLGKSTGAIKCAARFDQFKIKRDTIFSREDVMKALSNYQKGVIVADEMINVTFNRDFYGEDQKKLIKMLNMYRDRFNILIACVPNFYSLDSQFRSLVKMRINLIRRGFAVIHTPNQSSFSIDKWDTKYNEKIERTRIKRKNFSYSFKKMTTFRGIFKFGDITKKQREVYEATKQDKRSILMDSMEDPKKKVDIYEKMLTQLKDGILTKERLLGYCLMSNLKYNSVVVMLNKRLKDSGEQETLTPLLIRNELPNTNRIIDGKKEIQRETTPIALN